MEQDNVIVEAGIKRNGTGQGTQWARNEGRWNGNWLDRNKGRWNSTRLLVGQESREMEKDKVIGDAGIKRNGTGQGQK